jgi:SAM-dependent methyltransferase
VSEVWTSSYRRQRFDSLASAYDEFCAVWDRLDPSFGQWLAGQAPAARERALDLGCGLGRHVPLLAGRFDEVLAVDPSVEMLRSAHMVDRSGSVGPAADRSRVEYQLAGILRERGESGVDEPWLVPVTAASHGQFDCVVSVLALHHAGPAERVLPLVRELVAPGGRLVVADFVADPDEWADGEWQVARAGESGEWARHLGGSAADVAVVERLLLHPRWLAMVAQSRPLSREDFAAAYAAVFPGAVITLGEVGPEFGTCVWTAPSAPPGVAGVASQR